jgi:hypothetical protein
VIYPPQTKRWSHYSECCLPGYFHPHLWFARTRAATLLPRQAGSDEKTSPFGS